MKKTLIALSTAALVAAGSVAVPQKADAFAPWIIPAIVAAGVGGVVVGDVATQTYYAGPPRGEIYVRPMGGDCRFVRERGADGYWHQVQVCG